MPLKPKLSSVRMRRTFKVVLLVRRLSLAIQILYRWLQETQVSIFAGLLSSCSAVTLWG